MRSCTEPARIRTPADSIHIRRAPYRKSGLKMPGGLPAPTEMRATSTTGLPVRAPARAARALLGRGDARDAGAHLRAVNRQQRDPRRPRIAEAFPRRRFSRRGWLVAIECRHFGDDGISAKRDHGDHALEHLRKVVIDRVF